MPVNRVGLALDSTLVTSQLACLVLRLVGVCLTQGRPLPDILSQEIAGGDGGELREALEHAFGLGSFADACGADKDDAGGAAEMLYHARRGARGERLTKPGNKSIIMLGRRWENG